MYVPEANRGIPIEWDDLTTKEQNSFLRQGYKPPEGSIIHGNGDIENEHPQVSV